MKISTSTTSDFKPYTITIEVETQEEHRFLRTMSKFNVSIPAVFGEGVDKTKCFELLRMIERALEDKPW